MSYRKRRTGCAVVVALSIAVFAFVQAVNADTIYQETFSISAGTDLPYANVGWFGYGSSACTAIGGTSDAASYVNAISQSGGSDSAVGYAYARLGTPGVDAGVALLATSEFSLISLTANAPLTFSWLTRNNVTSTGEQLALKIGDAWYASGSLITAGTSWASETVSLASVATWYSLTVAENSTLSLDASKSVSLPTTGNIVAAGLFLTYSGTADAVARVDNFTISGTVVPEPGMLALLAAAAMGLIAYAWKKRH